MEQATSYRRSYERFKVDGSATLVLEKNLEIPSILTDLSGRGAGIFSSGVLQVNDRIKVIIKAPFFVESPLYKEARVAWYKRLNGNNCQAGLDFGADNLIQFA
ncbi:MAG: PilZ domain-containing protein [Candidatus Omnitrophota bacterium]